jgi:hypothetical protein
MLRVISQVLIGSTAIWAASFGQQAGAALLLNCETFPPTVSLTQLLKTFATADVGRDSVPLGPSEGDMVPATVLFATDPARRIEIVWKDAAAQTRPQFVLIARRPTRWRTPGGVTIGTSLRDLERLNGRPFRLAGFGFDGSGAVTSWNGGRLSKLTHGRCQLRVNADSLTAAGLRSARFRTVIGEREFSSAAPAMQVLNPRVSRLLLEYP